MRLIDAEELGKKIEEEFDGICAYDVSPDEAVNDFQDIVDSCKTIDAAPVVHGRWKIKSQRFINKETGEVQAHYIWNECSICRKHNQYKSDFCPYCGAKMDESEDNSNE